MYFLIAFVNLVVIKRVAFELGVVVSVALIVVIKAIISVANIAVIAAIANVPALVVILPRSFQGPFSLVCLFYIAERVLVPFET